MTKAICTVCLVEKPTVQFRKSKRTKTGYINTCALCHAKQWRERYYLNKQRNREKINAYRTKRLEVTRALNRDSYHRNKHSRNDIVLMKRYGITGADREAMYDRQQGKCAICGRHESEFKRGLHIDHSHITGRVRKLLCYHCNRHLVGHHTLETAKKVYEYLREYESDMPKPQGLDTKPTRIP